MSRPLSVAGAESADRAPIEVPAPPRNIRITIFGMACLLCGATIGVKFDIGGELYLFELLIALLALQCLLSRGPGQGFVASVFIGFAATGLITLCGYLLADLLAANEPWQYLKGWGRVGLLIVDSLALIVLAAHDRRSLWWLALGIGLGGVAVLLFDGVPLTQWKLGYAEFAVLLVLTLAPLGPKLLSATLVGAFGAGCIVVDYRSLGALCLLVSAAMLWQGTSTRQEFGKNWLRSIVVAVIAIAAIAVLLFTTQKQYDERRQESNIGRYVGLVVAWRAITESPLVGYGSWAADERFGRMLKSEIEHMDHKGIHSTDLGSSLLPHSQLLQVWVEGGILGVAFFCLYGWRLLGALRWFVWRRPPDALTPAYLFFLAGGLLDLLISPFLGPHRISISIAVALTALAVHESRAMAKHTIATSRAKMRHELYSATLR